MTPTLATLATIWLATLFVYSGSLKLVNYQQARSAIAGYRLMPDPLARVAGAFLPWSELAAAFCLLVPATRSAGAALAISLGASFAVAAGSALVRRIDASCGCTGGSDRINWMTLARASAMISAGVLVMRGEVNLGGVIATAAVLVSLVAPGLAFLRRRRARGTSTPPVDVSGTEIGRLTALLARPAGATTEIPAARPVVVEEPL